MNGPALYGTLFALVSLALLVAPFYPAWSEWYHPTDRQPLGLGGAPASHNPQDVGHQTRTAYQRLSADPQSDHVSLEHASTQGAPLGADSTVISEHATVLDEGLACRQPVLSSSDLQLRGRNDLTEVRTSGHLMLGAGSQVHHMAYAGRSLLIGPGSVCAGELLSRHGVVLSQGCSFERVSAPVVLFGSPPFEYDLPEGEPVDERHWDRLPTHPALPGATPWGLNGWRVEGDCDLLPGHCFNGTLLVTGVLRLGAGALLRGTAKAHRGVSIGPGACVSAGVFSNEGIHLHVQARAHGAVVAERWLWLGGGAQLGTPEKPCSASAAQVWVEPGVTLHGTLWALQAGRVGGLA